MKSSVSLVTAIFVTACIFRLVCEINKVNVVIIMAFINALSLMFVIYFLVHNIDMCVSNKLSILITDLNRREKRIKTVRIILNILTVIGLGVFGIAYMFHYTALGNDIISIIALGISIITSEVSEGIGNIIAEKMEKKV